MKINEIRTIINKEELQKILQEKIEAVAKMRFEIASKQIKKHRDIRKNKKDIAKIKTVLNEQSVS